MIRTWPVVLILALALSSCAEGVIPGPARQFTGVYLYEFEGSTFIEGATEIPSARPHYGETDWLDWNDEPRLERLIENQMGNPDCYEVQPFMVTFVGRRTRNPFRGAGHLELWRSKVTIDRTISAERLGPSFCYDR